MIYELDENILIYNLIDKIPIIKNLLLAESCKFFNNIVSHNNEYMNIGNMKLGGGRPSGGPHAVVQELA